MRCHVDPSASAWIAVPLAVTACPVDAEAATADLHIKDPDGTKPNAPPDMDRTPDLKGSAA